MTKVQTCAQKTRRDALIIRYKSVGHNAPQGAATERPYFGSSFPGSLAYGDTMPFWDIWRMCYLPPSLLGKMVMYLHRSGLFCIHREPEASLTPPINLSQLHLIHWVYPPGLTCTCPASSAHSALLWVLDGATGCDKLVRCAGVLPRFPSKI